MLLADVTGHGVQASLKATGCYMVARNTWQRRKNNELVVSSLNVRSKFQDYHEQTTELLTLFSETPEIAAFAGVEIFPRSGRACIYRNNFHVPVILDPDDAGGWIVKSYALGIAEVREIRIKPGTVIALFSDGFVDGSRQMSRLNRFIESRLGGFDGCAATLRKIFADFNEQNTHRPHDDRTLVVLTWKRDEYMSKIKKGA